MRRQQCNSQIQLVDRPQMPPQNKISAGWLPGAYVCMGLPIVMLLVVCVVSAPEWLDSEVARQNYGQTRWGWMFALSLLVSGLAIASLIYLVRHNQRLSSCVLQQSRARVLELSNLGAGLAHEVRNPLHALRINLHILRRAIDGRASLPEDQLLATTRESDTAIDRIDAVLRDLLEFVEPNTGNAVEIELGQEVQTVLGLLAETLKRDQITVDSSGCREAAIISMDATRLRQVLLNLLTFARLRAGKQGRIELVTMVSGDKAELSFAHGGPSLTGEQAARLFEPFRSPIDTGSGLDMALVKAQVLAAGGSVRYEQPNPPGNRLVLSLPIGRSVHKESQHELQT